MKPGPVFCRNKRQTRMYGDKVFRIERKVLKGWKVLSSLAAVSKSEDFFFALEGECCPSNEARDCRSTSIFWQQWGFGKCPLTLIDSEMDQWGLQWRASVIDRVTTCTNSTRMLCLSRQMLAISWGKALTLSNNIVKQYCKTIKLKEKRRSCD